MFQISFLAELLRVFEDLVQTGLATIKVVLAFWASALLFLELSRTLGTAALDERPVVPALIKWAFRSAVWIAVIFHWPMLANGVRDAMVALGLRIGNGGTINAAQFLDPSQWLDNGIRIGQVLNDAFRANLALSSLGAALFFIGAWVVFLGAFAAIGFKMLILQIEFGQALLFGIILLPAVLVRGMGWLASGNVSFVINAGMRFFVMAGLAGLTTPLIQRITGAGQTFETGITLMVSSVVLAVLFWWSDKMVAGWLQGTPTLGVGSVVQAAAAGAVLMAGGLGAVGAGSRSLVRMIAGGANAVSGGRLHVPMPQAPPVPAPRLLYNTLVSGARHLHDGGQGGVNAHF